MKSNLGTRMRRIGAVGAAGAAVLLTPGIAQAGQASSFAPSLAPSGQICVSLRAEYQATVTGFSDEPGVTFKVTRDGALIYATGQRETYLPPLTFYGAGRYQICGKNPAGLGQAVTNV